MQQLTDYYIMMIDGTCEFVQAIDKRTAFFIVADRLDYDDFGEFLDDVNLAEWKDETHRIVEQYSGSTKQTERFSLDTPYQLSEYLKTTYEIQNS